MPEGDTIHRAARALHQALAGNTVTRFETMLPALARVDFDAPLRGRQIESVEARGKWCLMHFSCDLVLATHMRMHGSWHLYRPGECWRQPRRDMRVLIETEAYVAVAFRVPVAEFHSACSLARHPAIEALGPDLLAPDFDLAAAVRKLRSSAAPEVASALLDQRAMAGVGNVFKSEILFLCATSPFAAISSLTDAELERLVITARKLLASNARAPEGPRDEFYSGSRRTTGMMNPRARLWVYDRAGKPCRKCGTAIQVARHGPGARATYWCPICQKKAEAGSSAPDSHQPVAEIELARRKGGLFSAPPQRRAHGTYRKC
jgi:endonuclease-8